MPYLCTAPSQITDQVQPFVSGTFTVNVAKLLAIVAEILCAWISGERSNAVAVGIGEKRSKNIVSTKKQVPFFRAMRLALCNSLFLSEALITFDCNFQLNSWKILSLILIACVSQET